MSGMYQPLTTPRPEYVRTESPVFQNRSLDFCNSFWGLGDAGVDVLFARMRGAAQTIEDLNTFWKERASIEEDYAKRLAKLAQMTLGRNETGDLRKSLDTMATETECQAEFHLILAQQLRSGFELPTTAFHARLLHHKKTHQAGIEKLFKKKQIWESCVNEAREKYEQGCAQIESFKAQASLDLGKVREEMDIKLERIQKTNQTQEHELSDFSMSLNETVIKWEQDWKSFCDSCQDMEEDRMDFLKINLCSYANAVSKTYMADVVCCELMGTAFQLMESEKDVANFVLESGSGDQIPDPFDFVNYSAPNDTPSFSSQPTSHIAEFIRFTSQELPSIQNSIPLALKEGPVVSAADIGDGKGATNDPDVDESVVGASFQRITVSSKAQPTPYTNDIHLSASMTNQNGGLDPLTTPLDQLQNTISTSQKARRPLPIPPTVPVSIVPKSTEPAGVEVAQALEDWQPAFEEYMSPSQRNRTGGSHALSLNQIATGGGDGGGAQLPAEILQHHDPSNPVWRSPSKPLFQAVDNDDLDSDEADESGSYYSAIDSSGSYYSAVDEPEMHMPVMLPQTSGQFNSFLKQHEHNSLNSNVNPINFVIKKMMKARRIAHSTHSTSGSSMKVDTDSFMSRFSESAENFSPVSLSTS